MVGAEVKSQSALRFALFRAWTTKRVFLFSSSVPAFLIVNTYLDTRMLSPLRWSSGERVRENILRSSRPTFSVLMASEISETQGSADCIACVAYENMSARFPTLITFGASSLKSPAHGCISAAVTSSGLENRLGRYDCLGD